MQGTLLFWEQGDLPVSNSVAVLACFHSRSVQTEALSGQGISQFRVSHNGQAVYSLFKAKYSQIFFNIFPNTADIFYVFLVVVLCLG